MLPQAEKLAWAGWLLGGLVFAAVVAMIALPVSFFSGFLPWGQDAAPPEALPPADEGPEPPLPPQEPAPPAAPSAARAPVAPPPAAPPPASALAPAPSSASFAPPSAPDVDAETLGLSAAARLGDALDAEASVDLGPGGVEVEVGLDGPSPVGGTSVGARVDEDAVEVEADVEDVLKADARVDPGAGEAEADVSIPGAAEVGVEANLTELEADADVSVGDAVTLRAEVDGSSVQAQAKVEDVAEATVEEEDVDIEALGASVEADEDGLAASVGPLDVSV